MKLLPRSIRNRLLLSLMVGTVLVWSVSGYIAYRSTLHEVDELLDAHLAQSAALLLAQAGEFDEIDTEHLPLLHKYSRRVAFQVWEHGQVLRLHSLNAPNVRLSNVDSGFADERIDGRRWRVYSVWSDDLLIQVAEEGAARGAIAHGFAKGLVLPLLLGVPLLGLMVMVTVERHLLPLLRMSGEIERRAPDHLAPLPVMADTPAELEPLVARLNTLFGQLSESFEAERRFTADAAHELRTPIAGLKAQAQVAQRATADGERQQALAKVIQGCDRAARLIEQLLTLARLDPAHIRQQATTVDLRQVAAQVTADLAPVAMQRSIELSVEGPGVVVSGHADLLAVLLRNLVDNAIRYSPDAAAVQVRTGLDADGAFLQVVDQGPGIEAAQLERLGQRFQRLGRADVEGTGLGLSIVRRIAELHRASLAFGAGDGGRGLCVALRFRGAPSAR